MVGRRGNKRVRQLLIVHPWSGSREMKAGAQLTVYFSFSLGFQPMGWSHTHLGCVFPAQ